MSRPRRVASAAAPARRLFPEPPAAPRRARATLGELMVLTSDEDLVRWNRRRIAEVLLREAQVDEALADRISRDIESTLIQSRLTTVTTALLRELVGAELVSRGLTSEWLRHARLGVSLYDAGALLRGAGGEPGAASPEACSRRLGARIKRDYALAAVLGERVAEAHRQGVLHVHDLEAIDRPSSLTLRLFGMPRRLELDAPVPGAGGDDGDALVARLADLAARLGERLAQPLTIQGLNLLLAPLASGRPEAEVLRLASRVLARLGAAARVQATLHFDLPPDLAALAAPGCGDRPTSRYADHAASARRMAAALIEAAAAGSPGRGAPVELILVVGPTFFRTSGHLAFLERAAEVARAGAALRFRFRREGDGDHRAAPADGALRPVGRPGPGASPVLALVSVSLPRLAFRAGDDLEGIEDGLRSALDLAARAHMDKRVFIEDLLARGERGPLGPLADRSDGAPLLDVEEALCPVLLSGLNEVVEAVSGHGLHAGGAALELGLRLLATASRQLARLSRRHKLRLVLGGAPLELPAARFARLDLRHHALRAGHHLKGELARGQVRYTPGISLDLGGPIAVRQRLELEGKLQELAPWGSCSLIPAAALAGGAALLLEAYTRSGCRELAILRDPRAVN